MLSDCNCSSRRSQRGGGGFFGAGLITDSAVLACVIATSGAVLSAKACVAAATDSRLGAFFEAGCAGATGAVMAAPLPG